MKDPKKILVIIQRSNGDVFLSYSLIQTLYNYYESPEIDILVNDDTYEVANLFSNINCIHIFSYLEKRKNRWGQEKKIFKSLFRKYDLSINLTASDRSVFYALISGKKSISAIESDISKSWWKKFFLTNYYFFDTKRHILLNNLQPLALLNINYLPIQVSPEANENALNKIKDKLDFNGIKNFIIFHPSAQYPFKIYPKFNRDKLLLSLDKLNIKFIITGGTSDIDLSISKSLPFLRNAFNWIGQTSIEEYVALSQLSLGYLGMDTLNMHIAAAQTKRIFAIFGPTNLSMWSPWSNYSSKSTHINMPKQTYGNITLFQADMACVACGKKGCENKGYSKCLDNINHNEIIKEVKKWVRFF